MVQVVICCNSGCLENVAYVIYVLPQEVRVSCMQILLASRKSKNATSLLLF